VNYKRKSRRRFFLLMWSRTPLISSEFRGGGGGGTPNPPPRYATASTFNTCSQLLHALINTNIHENNTYGYNISTEHNEELTFPWRLCVPPLKPFQYWSHCKFGLSNLSSCGKIRHSIKCKHKYNYGTRSAVNFQRSMWLTNAVTNWAEVIVSAANSQRLALQAVLVPCRPQQHCSTLTLPNFSSQKFQKYGLGLYKYCCHWQLVIP